jgi:hypothetical protein
MQAVRAVVRRPRLGCGSSSAFAAPSCTARTMATQPQERGPGAEPRRAGYVGDLLDGLLLLVAESPGELGLVRGELRPAPADPPSEPVRRRARRWCSPRSVHAVQARVMAVLTRPTSITVGPSAGLAARLSAG